MDFGYCSFKEDLWYEGKLIWKKDVKYDIICLAGGYYFLMTEDFDLGNLPFGTKGDEVLIKELVYKG